MPLFLRLLKHKRGAWISFVSIYALGLSVFLVVNGMAKNFQEEIRVKSKELLEGDLRVHARRPFTGSEEGILSRLVPPGSPTAEVWGFLSMLRVGAGDSSSRVDTAGPTPEMAGPGQASASRLVQVKAISTGYPLVGGFTFAGAPGATASGLPEDATASGLPEAAWSGRMEDFRSGDILIPRDLSAALKIKAGDSVSLGNKTFVVKDQYRSRPGGNFEFWEMGSRVYIPLADMAATGLERKGSRIFRYRFFMLPEGTAMPALRDSLEAAFADPEVDVSVYTDPGSDLGRSFQMVTAFLKMLSLSAFLLSAVGAAFFFRHHLVGERKTVAVLTTLGATRKRIIGIYVAQNLFLSCLAAAAGILLARVWSIGLPLIIARLYAVELPSSLPWSTFLIGPALAVSTSMLFGVTGFAGLGKIPPATLIKPMEGAPLGAWLRAAMFVAQGAFFYVLAMADSRSWLLSALAVGSMGGAFLMLAALGWLAFRVLWTVRLRFGYALRIVLGSIKWGREKSLLAFAALGFVAFTSCLVPQLQNLILDEIRVPQGRVIPQLFLFDIQEEQLDGLRELIRGRGRELAQTSPMVRARLERVNGEVFKRDEGGKSTLEQRNRRQFRNRGFNLSYRDSVSDAETLVAGSFWKGPAAEGAIPEISMEKEFAKRLKLKLGDTLSFDVQGVEVEGRISSMRQVRWASFQPNFFVLFQPGALEDAPKSFLGTLNRLPPEEAEDIQNRVSEAFPNVTVLNLQDLIARTVETLGKLTWLVRFLSGFALLIGLAILWLVVDALVSENQRTVMLLRTLGEPRLRLVGLFLIHYAGFCLAAGLTGYFLSLAAVFVINLVVWQVPWSPDLVILAVCASASLAVGVLCSLYAAFRGAGQPLRGLLALSRA